jgi:hypothetical protein
MLAGRGHGSRGGGKRCDDSEGPNNRNRGVPGPGDGWEPMAQAPEKEEKRKNLNFFERNDPAGG